MNAEPGWKIFRKPRAGFPAVCAVALVAVAATVASPPAGAHGSVVDENDLCVISMGFYRAHFTIYQPRTSGHAEYCEDLPGTGETVFVLDYLHDSMRTVPVEFRIVRDRNGIGRFARYEDVLDLDLDRDTVFYAEPGVEGDAVYTALYDFDRPGGYIGVVAARHPDDGEIYRAVFPFQVGALPFDAVLWSVIFLSAGVGLYGLVAFGRGGLRP